MSRQGSRAGFLPALLVALLSWSDRATGQESASDGRFFLGAALAHQAAGADLTKGVTVSIPPPSSDNATSRSEGTFRAAKLLAGYRRDLRERVSVAVELDGALYPGAGLDGFLEGTGITERTVWPGAWTLAKRGSVGLSAGIGFSSAALEAALGRGASVHASAGAEWLHLEAEVGYRGLATGVTEARHRVFPWVGGAGLRIPRFGGELGLEVRVSRYELDWSETASEPTAPRLDFEFGVAEWRLWFGYRYLLGT